MFINFESIHLYISLVILAITLAILRLQGKSPSYLLFCAIFGTYLIGAISLAVFPFFIVTDHSSPDFHPNVNLIPFDFGSCFDNIPRVCYQDMFNNILLTVPFGFGIHFIARIKLKYIPWVILAIGCSFELTQLIMAFILRNSFRAIDINDAIFNTTGAFIGYGFFKLFGWLYSAAIRKLQFQPHYIFAYIYDIVRQPDYQSLTTNN